jgi:tRNA(Arg) A34 adenosine deaminase TadA
VDNQDERYLRAAIRLAGEARQTGDQPYGALLVAADGTVLAEDRNTVVTERGITSHPELKLARWAARELSATATRTTTMWTAPAAPEGPACRDVGPRPGRHAGRT